jgi:short-subunit dehydrogenase
MTQIPSMQGRTLFITGASRGIGRAIALRYPEWPKIQPLL